tara:strand:+ start:8057 stop:8470 length:414 start_codon:yes stop_codon:yes gene_type:complete
MSINPDSTNSQLINYRTRSASLLEKGFSELRDGRWAIAEELIWGSLTLATKEHALSLGHILSAEQEIRNYIANLGEERRDRQMRDSFNQLDSFHDMVEKVRESGLRLDYLFMLLDDVASTIEKLWSSSDDNLSAAKR